MPIQRNPMAREVRISKVIDHTPSTKSTDEKYIWVCIGVVAAALLIVWPFAEMSYGDDTAYIHVALHLARTGHLAYDGWEAAILVLHAYWGALFIRLFGFSFNCVRLSTIPFALGAVGLCYLLVRRAGLQARYAAFVTILFGLCPLFLPVAVSYMTDVPGLFFMFASLYALTRAAEASSEGLGYGWLALGVVTGFLGGTGRQVVWLVPLIVLPYLAWARRRQTWFAFATFTGWILVLAGVVGATMWFSHQLYVVYQPSVLNEVKLLLKSPLLTLNITSRLTLMLLLVSLPAAVPLVLRASLDTWKGSRKRQIIVATFFLGLVCSLLLHPSLASIPWISSTLNWEGINGAAPLPGRPVVLIRPIRALVAIAVYATVCILAGEVVNLRVLLGRALRPLLDPSDSRFALPAMSLFSVGYFALVVIRGTEFDIFDRYLLPLLPWAATVVLLWFDSDGHAERLLQRAMPMAWTLLAALAFYGIASTQDLWSLARARVTATKRMEAAGVPRIAIDAGFEYNAWTELTINGRMNSRWVANPPGSYRADLGQTPSVVPLYRLENAPTADTVASEFGSVEYVTILPPFRKRVWIDRLLKH
ncbi:MAG: hypothetical protein NVS9B4_14470 [Candidatus Acidiferrum sp.]